MPIFAQGVTKDKLTILFFTRACDLDITREQLYRAMIENDCMSYFDFQSAMHELEEDGFIAAIPRVFGQGYRVSARGDETLRMFEESLPASLRDRLMQYATESREPMRRETQLTTSMEEQKSGGYRVHLRAQEQSTVVLDIELLLASRDMAQRTRSNWAGASSDIYGYLLAHLLKDGKETD